MDANIFSQFSCVFSIQKIEVMYELTMRLKESVVFFFSKSSIPPKASP